MAARPERVAHSPGTIALRAAKSDERSRPQRGMTVRCWVRGRSVHLRGMLVAATDLKEKSCEAETYEKSRWNQERRAPRLEGSISVHGDRHACSHSSPDNKFDNAEEQGQRTTTAFVCTPQSEDCQVGEDRCGQREHQPQPEEDSAQPGIGDSAGNDHHAREPKCRPTDQEVAVADHGSCGVRGPLAGVHEPWKHSGRRRV